MCFCFEPPATFERKYMFQTIMFSIYVQILGGVYANTTTQHVYTVHDMFHLHCTCFLSTFTTKKNIELKQQLRSWMSVTNLMNFSLFFVVSICPPKHWPSFSPSHLSPKKHGKLHMQIPNEEELWLRRYFKNTKSQKAQKGIDQLHTKRWLSNEKQLDCLGYIGDYTTQLCGDYNRPL